MDQQTRNFIFTHTKNFHAALIGWRRRPPFKRHARESLLKKYFVAVALASIVLAGVSVAADFEGVGNVRCGVLTNEYDNADANFKDKLTVAISQWAMGYVTGLNIRLPENQRRELEDFNTTGLADKIFASCRLAPAEPVAAVVTQMYFAAPPYRPGVS